MVEYNSLGSQFEEMGKTFQGINSLPHLVIGKDKPIKKSYIKCPYCNNTLELLRNEQNKPLNDKAMKLFDYEIVQWLIYIGVGLLLGFMIYRLIWG